MPVETSCPAAAFSPLDTRQVVSPAGPAVEREWQAKKKINKQ